MFAMACSALTPVGCQEESPARCEVAAGDGFEVVLYVRDQAEPVGAGSTVPVFTPPQGGVATELDVEFVGVASEGLESIRVDFTRRDGTQLAAQPYNGAGLPLLCTDAQTLRVTAMPVAFDASVQLADLDQAEVRMRVQASRVDDETFEDSFELRLAVSEY